MLTFFKNKDNRGFFSFWLAQLISQFGDRVHQMALVGLIAARNPGSSVELAKLLSFTIIPVFIIGPIAGVYIDRWDRRRTLFICDFIRGLLVLLIAFYLMHLKDIWPMYVAVFIIFSLSRFYVPAKMSFVPEIVEQKDLHVANSLVTTTGMIALVLGALLGGLIVEYSGSFGGFLWDAMTFFLSSLLVFSIATFRRNLPNKEVIITRTKEMIRSQKSIWVEIGEGIRYIQSQKQIGFILGVMSILFAAAGAVYVVIIVFIQQAFHSVTKDLGFLAVPLGVGLFLGSLAYGRWGARLTAFRTIFWSLILGGGMMVAFASCVEGTHNRFLAMGLSFVLGLVVGPIVIASNTVINQVTSKEMSGKVFAALEFVMHLAFILSMLASSFLADHIARVWILIAVGGLFLLVGVIGLFKSRHSSLVS
ncbi:MAG: MFS transporter [Candidatus Omnitrophica bacterium]|nr:MFS transporter [Candidatus Omnitrophota bacterium]